MEPLSVVTVVQGYNCIKILQHPIIEFGRKCGPRKKRKIWEIYFNPFLDPTLEMDIPAALLQELYEWLIGLITHFFVGNFFFEALSLDCRKTQATRKQLFEPQNSKAKQLRSNFECRTEFVFFDFWDF